MSLSLPWPDKRLSPNARGHWSAKSTAVAKARADACYAAKAAGVPALHEGPIRLLWTFHAPDNRARDIDNMIASCKGMADGLADAWRVNDARFEPTYRRGDVVKGGAVVIEVLP